MRYFFRIRMRSRRRVRRKARRGVGMKGSKKDFAFHKEAARALAKSRLEHFNNFYNFAFKRVAIRNQKTRWGSASSLGNLNFHYKIALLPTHLADYIIVHELCHLGEFNHSQKFWDLVAKAIPNHPAVRRELKRIGRAKTAP